MKYEEMVEIAGKYPEISVVRARRGDSKSITELISHIGKESNIEGYVLRMDDGR